jgi:hypothetical protein
MSTFYRFVESYARSPMVLVLMLAFFAWTPAAHGQAYVTCTSQGSSAPGVVNGLCAGNWTITALPSTGTTPGTAGLSSLIGYPRTTQVTGTVPAYLSCTQAAPSLGVPGGCVANKYFITNSPGANGLSHLIGYVYPSKVANSVPAYLSCNQVPPTLGVPGGCTDLYFITASAGTNGLSSFVGYVYPTSSVSVSTAAIPYVIGAVYYSPAGPGSTIAYGDQTVTGTTVSTTQSWNESVSVGISVGEGDLAATVTFGNKFGGSTMTSTDMAITTTVSTTFPSSALKAPATINHDYDEILIYLGVQMDASLQTNGTVKWSMDFSQIANKGFSEHGYYIPVGCLKATNTLPTASGCPSIVNFLTSSGITAASYPKLLGADPYATANPSPDPNRYILLNSFSFLPSNPTTNYQIVNSTTTTNSTTETYTYSESVSGGLTSLLKASDTIDFTNSSTQSNKTGSTATSTLILVSPPQSVAGQSTMFVYEDKIYKTFMFSFVDNGTP